MGDGPPRRTLAARLADRDRSRFTGRAVELAFLERCLDDADPAASVVLITGPGGIGKSTLLREAARRARDRGISVVAIDGRELGPAPEMLEAALRDAARHARPLVLLDSYERMTALGPYLRRELLPGLPDQALVVIAGRGTPDPGWFTGGWESVTARLDLGVLEPREAQRLLAAYGLDDARVPDIVDWAAGSPLALALAADAALADADWNAATGPDRPDIIKSLLHRLVETELHDIRPSALGIAVVARTTTRELVRGVLPDEDAETGYRQLSGLTVTEPLGDGFTMHELVRKALLADLRQRNPELERDLRRRIIDYLYARAKAGEPLLMIDMAHLVEDPLKRWGFGWDGYASFRIDNVRGDDADRIEAEHGDRQPQLWWQLTRRFFADSPEHVAVARDRGDQICGYMVCMTPATAPAFADADPLIGPWLAHARQQARYGDSVLWHAAVDLTGQGKVQAMLGMAGVLRTGAANPRFAYLPIDPSYPGATEFARAVGAAHLAELDADIGGQQVHCYRLDYGPAGLFDRLRDQVYSELGLLAPSPPPGPAVDLGTVREVLKNFRVPRELARSPLAAGTTVQERAESVRRLVRDGAQQAFGDSETEKLLHSVLVYGYLDPLRSHEEAASRLCLSRAAYFRRLRTAVERLAEYLAAAPLP
jgi:AAA ATPase domain